MFRLTDIMAPDAASMTGDLHDWPLGDMLLWLHQGQRTAELHVGYENGHGTIHLRQGAIYRAVCGELAGPEAVDAMMEIGAGEFSILPSYIPYPASNISGDTEALLLRWAIRRDESQAS